MKRDRVAPGLLVLLCCTIAPAVPAFALKPHRELAETCGPRSDGSACLRFECPERNQRCMPTAVECDAGGLCRITDCDCQRSGRCHVKLAESDDNDDVRVPVCVGVCPPGEDCEEVRTLLANGNVEVRCHCVPRPCEPADNGFECRNALCPDGERCTPTQVVCGPNGCRVETCDCQNRETCHPVINHDDDVPQVTCVGTCPPGTVCEEKRTPISNTEVLVECDCVPVPQECGANELGNGCRDVECPIDGERCIPSRIVCGPNLIGCRVVGCDCRDPEECHPELNPAGVFPPVDCVGLCPPGQVCELQRRPLDNGAIALECHCVQPECEPNDAGTDCNNAVCPDDGQKCKPTRIFCNANNNCRVIDCDCVGDRCHMELTAAGPVCVGGCPEGHECIQVRDVTPAGILVRCDCRPIPPPECEPNEDRTGCTDAPCATTTQNCRPTALVCSANGGCRVEACDCVNDERCHIEFTDGGPVCMGRCPDEFVCETIRVPVSSTEVLIRCNCAPEPQECEPDSTGFRCKQVQCEDATERCMPKKVVCLPNVGCRVVECNCDSAERCHIELTTAAGPVCVGHCPPGEVCKEVRTEIAGGGVMVECGCEPIAQECGPNDLQNGCRDVVCPNEGERCIPTRIVCGLNPFGCRVVDCECRDPEACHPELNPVGVFPPVDCTGACPPGQECELRRDILDNGLVAFGCRCVEQECEPNLERTDCSDVVCPDDDQKCRPSRVFCDANNVCRVLDCDCVGDRCHVELTAAAGPICVGGCPEGEECVQRRETMPNGGAVVRCDCQPIVKECEPNDTGTGCSDVECPNDHEKCTPRIVACDENGHCTVVRCDCGNPDRCHVELTAAAGPTCVGACPDDMVCKEFRRPRNPACALPADPGPCRAVIPRWFYNAVTGQCELFNYGGCEGNANNFATEAECMSTCPGGELIACDCVEVPRPCHRDLDDDGNIVCKGYCPEGEVCRKVESVDAAGNVIIDCDCVEIPRPCHRDSDDNGEIVCKGICPEGEVCRKVEIVDPATNQTIIDCECVEIPRPCRPEFSPATNRLECVGFCPEGMECRRFENDGFVGCDCVPRPCHFDPATNDCIGACPDGEVCQKIEIMDPATGQTIVDCDCQPVTPECRLEVTSSVGGVCMGSCPPGETCTTIEIINNDGTSTLECDCLPPVVECGPSDDHLGCNSGLCTETDDPCVPTLVECIDGECRVLECDCRSPDLCHVALGDTGQPFCDGPCPPGSVCTEILLGDLNGVFTMSCECRPAPPACAPRTDGFGCQDTNCPTTDEICQPTKVHCTFDGVCQVMECDCRRQDECHAVLGATPGAVSCTTGGCTEPEVCQTVRTQVSDGIVTSCECAVPTK